MAVSLGAESSIWFGITLVLIIVRVFSRKILTGSFLKLKADDFLMFAAFASDTAFFVAINLLAYTNTNLIDPDHPLTLTPEDIEERTWGSKLAILTEHMQILTIWFTKACILVMYNRLATSKRRKLAVRCVAGYVAFGFVLMEILWFTAWCRPLNQYWAVPTNNIQCSAEMNHLIVNAVFNVSSDVMIFAIPMPILFHANLPLRKKLVLGGVFALGIFTILAALVNKFYSFTHPYSGFWEYWYVRESSTALIVANLPFTWTIIQFAFNLQSFQPRRSFDAEEIAIDIPKILGAEYGHNSRGIRHNVTISRGSRLVESLQSFSESQENINASNNMAIPLKIYRQQEVRITMERDDDPDTESTRSRTSYSTKPSREHHRSFHLDGE
ncbi:hypothetical protein GGR57DRAFT_109049 [Xylariaceae sp. FL1272]|nr:hypothetical protein GGR57DRAFT_109049 [Xylariaceae sp. FL1272]